MTLRDFYLALPRNIQPKQEFLKNVMDRTGVTETTARNWILYGMKPMSIEHRKVLCELTNLSEEELWNNK